MNERRLTVAELALFAGTRVALGIGIGLLISRRVRRSRRKAAGLALTLLGGLSTIPLAIKIGRQGRYAQELPAA